MWQVLPSKTQDGLPPRLWDISVAFPHLLPSCQEKCKQLILSTKVGDLCNRITELQTINSFNPNSVVICMNDRQRVSLAQDGQGCIKLLSIIKNHHGLILSDFCNGSLFGLQQQVNTRIGGSFQILKDGIRVRTPFLIGIESRSFMQVGFKGPECNHK